MNITKMNLSQMLAGALLAAAAGECLAAEPAHEMVYAAYERAINRGDANAASAMFAPDGVIRGSRFCPAARPCTGRDEIRERFFQPMAHLGLRLSQFDAQSNGDTLTVRLEARNKTITGAGAERVMVIDRLVIRDGAIHSVDIGFDLTDPETARFIASTTAPPTAGSAQ